jgi:hypothetical protein
MILVDVATPSGSDPEVYVPATRVIIPVDLSIRRIAADDLLFVK